LHRGKRRNHRALRIVVRHRAHFRRPAVAGGKFCQAGIPRHAEPQSDVIGVQSSIEQHSQSCNAFGGLEVRLRLALTGEANIYLADPLLRDAELIGDCFDRGAGCHAFNDGSIALCIAHSSLLSAVQPSRLPHIVTARDRRRSCGKDRTFSEAQAAQGDRPTRTSSIECGMTAAAAVLREG
jgi:hypothetical protein